MALSIAFLLNAEIDAGKGISVEPQDGLGILLADRQANIGAADDGLETKG